MSSTPIVMHLDPPLLASQLATMYNGIQQNLQQNIADLALATTTNVCDASTSGLVLPKIKDPKLFIQND